MTGRNDAVKILLRERVRAKSSFRALKQKGCKQVCQSGKMGRREGIGESQGRVQGKHKLRSVRTRETLQSTTLPWAGAETLDTEQRPAAGSSSPVPSVPAPQWLVPR